MLSTGLQRADETTLSSDQAVKDQVSVLREMAPPNLQQGVRNRKVINFHEESVYFNNPEKCKPTDDKEGRIASNSSGARCFDD